MSPVKNFDYLQYFAIPRTGEEEAVIHKITLPDSIWKDKSDESEIAYWHGKVIDGKIYFLPNSAKAVLIVDVLSDEVEVVPLDIKDYREILGKKEFSAFEAIAYEDGVVITPCGGNKILLEKGGKIVKEYILTKQEIQESEKEQVVINYILEKGMLRWSQMEYDLEDKDTEIEVGQIGQTIYRTLTERNT